MKLRAEWSQEYLNPEKMEHFKISFITGIARPLYNQAHVTVLANIILALIVEKAEAMKRRDIKS